MPEEEVSKELSPQERIAARQTKITNGLVPHLAEIQKALDSLTALAGKETFQKTDIEGAFDDMDSIREKSDAIEELLFSLRDTIR
jgi:hypothetical protein